MTAVPAALVPVGRDCDCGHPLVWVGDEQRCAVYGTHPAPAQPVRFRAAPGAHDELIWQLATLPCPSSYSRRARRRREAARSAA